MRGRLPARRTARRSSMAATPASLGSGAAPSTERIGASTVGSDADLEQVFMPMGYEPGYAYPLLVWLADPAGKPFDLGKAMSRVSLRNFIAVQPARTAEDRLDHEPGVWRAIDTIRQRVSIHPQRVFLVGHGRGGSEAFRIACRHAGEFAGVVSLGGAFPHGEALFSRLDAIRRLPMLLCCRRESPSDVVRPTDATLRLFHAAGALLAMRIYPGRSDLAKLILSDVNRWLMEEICGSRQVQQAAVNS